MQSLYNWNLRLYHRLYKTNLLKIYNNIIILIIYYANKYIKSNCEIYTESGVNKISNKK